MRNENDDTVLELLERDSSTDSMLYLQRRFRESVLAVVKQRGWALEYASDKLRDDLEVVMAAVKQRGWALEYASDKLRDDLEVVMAAVKQKASALQYASEKLRDDLGVVLEAVSQNGLALQYASNGLRDDLGVVMAAVKQDGLALQYASNGLRGNREVVMKVVHQNRYHFSLQYASEDFKNNRDLVLEALGENPFAILHQTAIRFETEKDRSIHRDAFKRQAKILSTLQEEGSWPYENLVNQHIEHFKQLSEHNIDCISDMFAELKKDPLRMIGTLLANAPQPNLCLLHYLKKEDTLLPMLKKDLYQQEDYGLVFQIVWKSNFIEKLDLQVLKNVKDRLSNLPPQKKAKWDRFIYFLKERGSVKDDDLPDLVFTPKNNLSQSASSSSAGVAGLLPSGAVLVPEGMVANFTLREPQQRAVGSSSGTRGGGYPSSPPGVFIGRATREGGYPSSPPGVFIGRATREGGYPSSPPGVFIGRATREGGYLSFAPQPRVTGPVARGVGDVARGTEGASSSSSGDRY